MPVEVYHYPIQGTMVQAMTADASVLQYRFASIVGQMRVGLTMTGMLGIGSVVSPSLKEGDTVLVQSTGLAKVLVDKDVRAGDPVCIGSQGGIMPIEANGHFVGIAAEGGQEGDVVKVWLNIAPDFESTVQPFAERRLANARRAVSGAVKSKRIVGRYVALDG